MNPKDYSNYGLAQELLRLRTHAPALMAEAAERLTALASREEAPATPQAAPSSYINGADIRGNDDPIEVVRKLDAEYRRRQGER